MSEADRQENTALEEIQYALEPSTFHSMQEAQELAGILEENLGDLGMGAANVRPELVEVFSELVNNAAEHGMTEEGAHAHVRYVQHRRCRAFDMVVADSGPGIRATLEENPEIPRPETDAGAIGLAVQELVSGTGDRTRGIGPVDDRHRDEKAGAEAVDPLGLRPPHHVRRRRARSAGNGAQAGRHGAAHHPSLNPTAPRGTMTAAHYEGAVRIPARGSRTPIPGNGKKPAESNQRNGRKEMDTEQPGEPSPQRPLRIWQRMSWRWKVTLMGAVMGAFASALWTAPAAYLRPQRRVHDARNHLRGRVGPRDRRHGRHHAPPGNQTREGPQCDRLKRGPRPKDTGTSSA